MTVFFVHADTDVYGYLMKPLSEQKYFSTDNFLTSDKISRKYSVLSWAAQTKTIK